MKRLFTSFDLLKPTNAEETVRRQQECQVKCHELSAKDRNLNPGETVLARNYLKGPKCVPATVIAQTGLVSYIVQTAEDVIWKRHTD